MPTLLSIPREMLAHIISFLPTRDANMLAQTCRAAYAWADPVVWKDNHPTSIHRGPITWAFTFSTPFNMPSPYTTPYVYIVNTARTLAASASTAQTPNAKKIDA